MMDHIFSRYVVTTGHLSRYCKMTILTLKVTDENQSGGIFFTPHLYLVRLIYLLQYFYCTLFAILLLIYIFNKSLLQLIQ